MPQVSFAVAAEQFDTAHSETVIRSLYDTGLFKLGVKARPTTAGFEFTAGIKQRVIAADTMIVTFLPTLLILPAERRFGACLPGDTILFGAKPGRPFLICLANFCHAGILTK